ncbi:hypothetical protein [Paenibacillus contaminans]|jgi:hypothetical protein|uniref:hypothetical protein n=1 Tax=Paenibacillus contaminans TaxID=450362 RepID=UPI001314B0CB|nr:hypothetical protein [Paenibacillus contaminans]
MKKLLFAALIVGTASIATAFAVNGSADKSEVPTPLIKFDGNQVVYAENFPDCH